MLMVRTIVLLMLIMVLVHDPMIVPAMNAYMLMSMLCFSHVRMHTPEGCQYEADSDEKTEDLGPTTHLREV